MNSLSRFVLRHKRLVALMWLAVFVAGVIATPHVTNRLSQEFSLPGQKGFEADVATLTTSGSNSSHCSAISWMSTGVVFMLR